MELHHNLFVKHILQENYIQEYIETLGWFFNTKKFYSNKYPSTASNVLQLNQILKKSSIKSKDVNQTITMTLICNENPDDKHIFDDISKEELRVQPTISSNTKSNRNRKDKKKKKKKANSNSNSDETEQPQEDLPLKMFHNPEELEKSFEDNNKRVKKRKNKLIEDEIEAFERRLEEASCSSGTRVRLNISDEWINKIKQLRIK